MTSTKRRLVLASTSRYRRRLLERLPLPFEVCAPEYNEPPLKLEHEQLVLAHAVNKAGSLARRFPDALIIGSDQLVSFENEVLGKPGSELAAIEQLQRLSGKTHRLLTAVAVLDASSGRAETAVDVHEMTMRTLDEAALRAYVALDNPIDCAGAYKLEKAGIALFERIQGQDDTAVTGLPLLLLVNLLARLGVEPLGV